jgi:hypothetical protein
VTARATIALALVAIAGAATVATRTDARVRRPILLRIEGAFEAAPDGTRALRTVEVRIGKEASRQLAVTSVVNLGSGPLGATILDEAARYRPSFRLLGDAAQLEPLLSAARGRRVTITGNLTGGRNVLVSRVEVAGGSPSPRAAPEDGASPAGD